MTAVNPEVVAEIAKNGDPVSQVAELLANNAEAITAGAVFFVMLGNDVLAIGTDIMADGRFDPRSSKDWIALTKGVGRVVGSGASSLALYGALAKNTPVALGTVGVGVFAVAHVQKLTETAHEIVGMKTWKEKISKLGSGVVGAGVGGVAISVGELALFSADPGAWMLGNAAMISYFATHPKEAGQLADFVRSYYQKSVKK